jgi:hypothetical protein
MSTGPGPTRKDDGSHDASVDDIAELLVEEDSHQGVVSSEQQSDDGLDVMLETPGPVLATTFLPPPPAPPAGSAGEEGEGLEEAGAATNLAYEDLLAKLVLPAKAPEPEPTMPAPAETLPEALPAPVAAPIHELLLPPSLGRPSSPSLQVAPPTEEQTLVTDNPLVAEEQQAAAREGRASVTREQPPVVHEEFHPAVTEPVAALNGAAKSKLLYLMFGGLLVLGGMVLATVLLKLLMPTPAPQPPVVVAPAPIPQPPPAPPAQVQPLPPTPAPAAAAPPPVAAQPEQPAAAEPPAPEEEAPPAPPKPRPHRREGRARSSHSASAKAAAAPKAAASAPKAAAKSGKGGKKGKASSYVDPFDN